MVAGYSCDVVPPVITRLAGMKGTAEMSSKKKAEMIVITDHSKDTEEDGEMTIIMMSATIKMAPDSVLRHRRETCHANRRILTLLTTVNEVI